MRPKLWETRYRPPLASYYAGKWWRVDVRSANHVLLYDGRCYALVPRNGRFGAKVSRVFVPCLVYRGICTLKRSGYPGRPPYVVTKRIDRPTIPGFRGVFFVCNQVGSVAAVSVYDDAIAVALDKACETVYSSAHGMLVVEKFIVGSVVNAGIYRW